MTRRPRGAVQILPDSSLSGPETKERTKTGPRSAVAPTGRGRVLLIVSDEVETTASGSAVYADEVGRTSSSSVDFVDEVGRTPSRSVDFTDEVDRTTRHSVRYMNGGACVRMGGQIRSAPACVLRLRASCARACLAPVCAQCARPPVQGGNANPCKPYAELWRHRESGPPGPPRSPGTSGLGSQSGQTSSSDSSSSSARMAGSCPRSFIAPRILRRLGSMNCR